MVQFQEISVEIKPTALPLTSCYYW